MQYMEDNHPPRIMDYRASAERSLKYPVTVEFSLRVENKESTESLKCIWVFGDGAQLAVPGSTTDDVTVKHTYSKPGR